jgi:hypothetical protein
MPTVAKYVCEVFWSVATYPLLNLVALHLVHRLFPALLP